MKNTVHAQQNIQLGENWKENIFKVLSAMFYVGNENMKACSLFRPQAARPASRAWCCQKPNGCWRGWAGTPRSCTQTVRTPVPKSFRWVPWWHLQGLLWRWCCPYSCRKVSTLPAYIQLHKQCLTLSKSAIWAFLRRVGEADVPPYDAYLYRGFWLQ